MRTSHKAKDAAAEKRSYVCDTFTGHGKAHQPPLPASRACVFPVMLLGKAGEGAAVDLVRGGGDDAVGDRAQGGGPAAILTPSMIHSRSMAGSTGTTRAPSAARRASRTPWLCPEVLR